MTAAGGTDVLLDGRGISAGYGSHRVLTDVSLSLAAGEIVGLAGPNGSGKSTLLHCVTGYHELERGSVLVKGQSVGKLTRREVAAQVAFVPQHTDSVYSFTVLEMVLMGRHPFAGLGGVDSAEDVAVAMNALKALEIELLAGRPYGNLSGGEQQLVLLARAFAQQSPVIILDEPLTGLDIRHQFQLMSALRRASGQPGTGVLATFHDLAVAARWCTRLILLRQGHVLASGVPADVLTPANLAELYGVDAGVYKDPTGHLSIQVTGYSGSGDSGVS